MGTFSRFQRKTLIRKPFRELDKSMGIVTRIVVTLTKIKPIDPLGLSKRESHQERKCSHSESNCPANILHNKMSMQEKQTDKVIIDVTRRTGFSCLL